MQGGCEKVMWNVVIQLCVHIKKTFLENVVTKSYRTLSWQLYNVFTTLPEHVIVSWEFRPEVLRNRRSLVAAQQAYLWHGQFISAAQASTEYAHFAILPSSGLLNPGSCLAIWRFLRQLKCKSLSRLTWRWYTAQVSHAYRKWVVSTIALYIFSHADRTTVCFEP